MRRSILLLMLVLLPLRVWAADAMALRMAQSDMATLQAAATGGTQQAMPDDCPMTAMLADASGDDDASGANVHCSACHLCATPAASNAAAARIPVATDAPAEFAWRFHSADARRDLRPPIA